MTELLILVQPFSPIQLHGWPIIGSDLGCWKLRPDQQVVQIRSWSRPGVEYVQLHQQGFGLHHLFQGLSRHCQWLEKAAWVPRLEREWGEH